jgi:hypothetical protein
MARMIGKSCPTGPGGRDCSCCGDKPGKARTIARRAAKRTEKSKALRMAAQGW